jgi:hypothetical protein
MLKRLAGKRVVVTDCNEFMGPEAPRCSLRKARRFLPTHVT